MKVLTPLAVPVFTIFGHKYFGVIWERVGKYSSTLFVCKRPLPWPQVPLGSNSLSGVPVGAPGFQTRSRIFFGAPSQAHILPVSKTPVA